MHCTRDEHSFFSFLHRGWNGFGARQHFLYAGKPPNECVHSIDSTFSSRSPKLWTSSWTFVQWTRSGATLDLTPTGESCGRRRWLVKVAGKLRWLVKIATLRWIRGESLNLWRVWIFWNIFFETGESWWFEQKKGGGGHSSHHTE